MILVYNIRYAFLVHFSTTIIPTFLLETEILNSSSLHEFRELK